VEYVPPIEEFVLSVGRGKQGEKVRNLPKEKVKTCPGSKAEADRFSRQFVAQDCTTKPRFCAQPLDGDQCKANPENRGHRVRFG